MRATLVGLLVGLALAGSASAAPVRVGLIDSGIGAGDPTGHGTAVAKMLRGSAAARGARLRLVAFPDVNRAGFGRPLLMARAIRDASAARMRVVNISQTIPGRAGRVRRALAASPTTLFVVAAGNDGLDLAEPGLDRDPCSAPQPNVVCVGELGPGGRPAANSNFGPGVVDAWAAGPGGTSFAAPRVSAHAAALFFHHPTWTVARVRAALVMRSR
ncbi:MAG TPA: S8 family serine peptidase [Solirubrobacterales bacterium]|nr:S8 family serine peptidase [Solirubrobacterales bacterium]